MISKTIKKLKISSFAAEWDRIRVIRGHIFRVVMPSPAKAGREHPKPLKLQAHEKLALLKQSRSQFRYAGWERDFKLELEDEILINLPISEVLIYLLYPLSNKR